MTSGGGLKADRTSAITHTFLMGLTAGSLGFFSWSPGNCTLVSRNCDKIAGAVVVVVFVLTTGTILLIRTVIHELLRQSLLNRADTIGNRDGGWRERILGWLLQWLIRYAKIPLPLTKLEKVCSSCQ